MEKLESKRGITLVALIITVIVLLILAGITINLTIGDGGIIKRAQEAGKNYINAADYERNELAELTNITDNIITNVTGGNVQEITPIIDNSELNAGDYIKYDSGENGVIMCRVLYPTSSEYGLQIISDKSVKKVTLGVDGDYSASTTAYNNAIETLNKETEKYINSNYAYDARCVGSAPTIKNGMFEDKNKVKFEGTTNYVVPNESNYLTLQAANYIKSYATDINYETDKIQMEEEGIGASDDSYWLASRNKNSSAYLFFDVRFMRSTGTMNSSNLCRVSAAVGNYGFAPQHGLRPCISLKTDIIKIVSGDGKSGKTAYVIAK